MEEKKYVVTNEHTEDKYVVNIKGTPITSVISGSTDARKEYVSTEEGILGLLTDMLVYGMEAMIYEGALRSIKNNLESVDKIEDIVDEAFENVKILRKDTKDYLST